MSATSFMLQLRYPAKINSAGIYNILCKPALQASSSPTAKICTYVCDAGQTSSDIALGQEIRTKNRGSEPPGPQSCCVQSSLDGHGRYEDRNVLLQVGKNISSQASSKGSVLAIVLIHVSNANRFLKRLSPLFSFSLHDINNLSADLHFPTLYSCLGFRPILWLHRKWGFRNSKKIVL